MKQDNRGITLVELIIACATAVIIMGAATLFIKSALNGYKTASDTIDLQMESQVLMEQLSIWIMEGNKVDVYEDVATGDKTLIIYEMPRYAHPDKIPVGPTDPTPTVPDASRKKIGLIDGKLYMTVETLSHPYDVTATGMSAADATIEKCIGEYVTEFTPVVDGTNPDKVTVKLKLASGTREYEIENEFKVRNELLEPVSTP